MTRTLATLLLLSLVTLGCGGPGSGSGAPTREGIVVYRDLGRPGSAGLVFVFTTDASLAEEYETSRVSVGTLSGERRDDSEATRIMRERLQSAGSPPPRRVSPEWLGALMTQLDQAGLFKLPQHPGDVPPPATSFFSLDVDGRKQIFVRPSAGASADDLKRWRDSKLVLIRFQSQS